MSRKAATGRNTIDHIPGSRPAVIGYATPDSVRLWGRTGRPGDFSLVLYDGANISRRAQTITPPPGAGGAAAAPLSHSVARIRLF